MTVKVIRPLTQSQGLHYSAFMSHGMLMQGGNNFQRKETEEEEVALIESF